MWRNRGVNVLIGRMIEATYLGISASVQMLAVFQRTKLADDYPPHFLKHLSSSSLDRKPFKDLTVKLLSFLCFQQN